MSEFIQPNECPMEDVAAYLDGELGDQALESFEGHLKECPPCATELRAQRRLLCTLDVAFNESQSFDLPKNFARVVTAHAESNMSGMRRKGERRRALQMCAVLALVAFGLLGAASGTLVFQPARAFLRVAGSLLDLGWRTLYDAGTGTTVIVRMLGRAIALGPYGMGVFFVIVFLVAISLLPLLIVNYHRAQIVE